MSHSVPQSPFFSRAYGGYTSKQIAYYEMAIGKVVGKRILDPMAGQAFAIAQLSHQGAQVSLIDVNPAPLLLASLRDPEVIVNRAEFVTWLEHILSKLAKRRVPKSSDVMVSGWISPGIRRDIAVYARLAGIGLFPPLFSEEFWNHEKYLRFAVAVLILAARRITCFQTSDNLTWLKPGGIAKEHRLCDPLREVLSQWNDWASAVTTVPGGSLSIQSLNLERDSLSKRRKFDFVVTSPPYANRLDYSRLWAPEVAVLSELSGRGIEDLRTLAIGTNFVACTNGYEACLSELPESILRALAEIRDDAAKYSASYYYPFFRNYAISLSRGLKNCASTLATRGEMLVFLRDTVRKDTLFPSGQLVISTLTAPSVGLNEKEAVKNVIKAHIGNVRRISSPGLYGLAQVEWWLRFEKKRTK